MFFFSVVLDNFHLFFLNLLLHILSLLMAWLIWRYVRDVIYRLNFESQPSWTVYNFKFVEILVFTIFAISRRGYQFFEPTPWCELENMQNIFHKLVFHYKNIKNYSNMNSSSKNIKYSRYFLRSWNCFDFFCRGWANFLYWPRKNPRENFDYLKVLFHSVLLVRDLI